MFCFGRERGYEDKLYQTKKRNKHNAKRRKRGRKGKRIKR